MKRTLVEEKSSQLHSNNRSEQEQTPSSKRPRYDLNLATQESTSPFLNLPLELRDKIYHYLWLDPPTPWSSISLGSIYVGDNRLRFVVTACYEGLRRHFNSKSARSWLWTNKQMLREGMEQLTFNSIIGLQWSLSTSRKRKRGETPKPGDRVSPSVDFSKVKWLEVGPIKLKFDYRNHPRGLKIDGRMGYRDTVAIDPDDLPYLDAIRAILNQSETLRHLKIHFRLPRPSGQYRMRMPPRVRPALDAPTRTRLEVEFDKIPFLEEVRNGLTRLEIAIPSLLSHDGYQNIFWPALNQAFQEGAMNIGMGVFGEGCPIERRDVGALHWERGDPANMWNYTFLRSQ